MTTTNNLQKLSDLHNGMIEAILSGMKTSDNAHHYIKIGLELLKFHDFDINTNPSRVTQVANQIESYKLDGTLGTGTG